MEIRASDEIICDFCSMPNPTRRFACPDFSMDQNPPPLVSKGDWTACSVCGSLIDAQNWNGLLLRAVDRLSDKYGPYMPKRILADTIKRSHDLFREHYQRPK